MSEVTYPFDGTGLAETNLIKGEIHTVTKINAAPYRMLIPDFAPFYLTNQAVFHIDELGNTMPLLPDIDFYNSIPFMAASRSTAQPVQGGIQLINTMTSGLIKIDYQTVGGEWTVDSKKVYERLMEYAFNPRTTWWDKLAAVPQLFPPTDHTVQIPEFRQIDVLFDLLTDIREAILQAPNNVPGAYIAHMLDESIHHATPEDMGLPPLAYMNQATDFAVLNKEVMADGKETILTFRQVMMLLRRLNLIS